MTFQKESYGEMKIPRLVLNKKSVNIPGYDYRGIKSHVTLHRTNNPGWYIKTKQGELVEITPDMLDCETRYLSLKFPEGNRERKLRVVEHLMALRFIGLDSIAIEIGENEHLPYEGGALNYWREIRDSIKQDGYLLSQEDEVRSESHTSSKGLKRKTIVDTGSNKGPLARVAIDYKIFGGRKEFALHLPDYSKFEKMLGAKPLGFPPWGKGILKMLRYRHTNNLLWPKKNQPNEEVLMEIAEHRMLDFLGAMSVLVKSGHYPSSWALISNLGNHDSDVKMVRQITKLISKEVKKV